MPHAPEPDPVAIGPRPYLDRLLAEYGMTEDDVRDSLTTRALAYPTWIDGQRYDVEYLVHPSVLRAHGEFGCAGDAEALDFCREIARSMVRAYGISSTEAVDRVNRFWSRPGATGRVPRVWIVGMDLAYHRLPDEWAEVIYFPED